MIMIAQIRNFVLIITVFLIHDQNIHRLATEIYKVANDLPVGDSKKLFDFKYQYTLHIPLINTELKGKISWKPECPCRISKKTFLQGMGFIYITERSILSVSTLPFWYLTRFYKL